jgi:hypothetical protein
MVLTRHDADMSVAMDVRAVKKPVEFVLVDGGVLQSRSSAIQIGSESVAQFSTLVFQNITIQRSHRSHP